MSKQDIKSELNSFFVNCFYSVLNAEERGIQSATDGKLTIKEIHVIAAVCELIKTGENNFSSIAKRLKITLGTLTTAFSNLERKGYLTKKQDSRDKRVYFIFPTLAAESVNAEHDNFHCRMTDGIVESLDLAQQAELITALKKLTDFFDTMAPSQKNAASGRRMPEPSILPKL